MFRNLVNSLAKDEIRKSEHVRRGQRKIISKRTYRRNGISQQRQQQISGKLKQNCIETEEGPPVLGNRVFVRKHLIIELSIRQGFEETGLGHQFEMPLLIGNS